MEEKRDRGEGRGSEGRKRRGGREEAGGKPRLSYLAESC